MDNFIIIQQILRMLITYAFPVALIFSMSRFRCRRRTMWLAFLLITLFGTAVSTFQFLYPGMERMKQLYALNLLVPCLIFLLIFTQDKPSQLLFNISTAINAIYLVSILSHFILRGSLDNGYVMIWQDALIRAAFYCLILFIFSRYLRDPYQFLAANMKRSSWRVLSAIPLLFMGLVMFLGLYPHVRTDNLLGVTFLYVILGFVYYIIYQVFISTYDLLNQKQDLDVLKNQVDALKNQVDAVQRSEDQLRIYRHDMRHYIAGISVLLKEGNTSDALRVIDRFDELNKETQLPRYCQNVMVNAILSLYLQRASDAGIVIRTSCDIPADLPVDAAELSTVFANAIENAIHACSRQAPGTDKRLEIHCVSAPQFLVEIANTYDGTVEFDEKNLPMAREPGHGIGTLSISTFAKKYGALLDYKAEAGMFRLRLLINNKDEEAAGR
ncbi:sensor histidine kinase [Diplocloster agilis]|uniref:ATP-binding protein n=1 Tax=Diplocloster agilis TaxID=2850323 RepID=A0A949NDX6_9FIRM|nr:ATP-binding protein [Diplocloster agilis]MBU9736471.1 ATP-binding protein [Diplocloster agilis]